jgi:two-component system LytT family response regulator
MSRVRALIVDDEKLARDRLRAFLEKRPEDVLVLEAKNGLEALEKLKSEPVDVLFLDIQMPGLSGMEVLAQLEKRAFQLIFQTAFDEFAIRAFEANACDYLLKPFSAERFASAFERALERKEKAANWQKLEEELRKRDGFLQKIGAKAGAKTVLVPVSEVIAFVSEDHYTTMLTADKEYLIDLSLSHLEERLDPERFQRLHRNSIVAMDRILAVQGGENMQVEVEGGRHLPVSRNNRKKLKVES